MKTRVVQAAPREHDDGQPLKRGIWHTTRLQVSCWQLNPGQQIVAHCHPDADDVVVVVRGSGDYLSFEDSDPAAAVQYVPRPDAVVVPPPPAPDAGAPRRVAVRAGSVGMAPAGSFHGLVNTGSDELVALVVTGADPSDSIYTVRE